MTGELPRIALLLTGGTIGAMGHGSLDLATYSDHARWATAEELIDRVPEIGEIATLEAVEAPRHRAMTWRPGDRPAG